MNVFQSLTDYLRDSKSELEKVTWPSRQDTIRYSSLVLAVSIIVAAFFASLDYGLDTVVAAALNRKTATQVTQPSEQTPVTPAAVPGLDIQTSSSTVVPVDIKTAPVEPATQPTQTPPAKK